MKELIKQNHENAYKKYQENWKREKKREKMLSWFIGTFIVVTTMLLIISFSESQNEVINNCIDNGKMESVCIERLG